MIGSMLGNSIISVNMLNIRLNKWLFVIYRVQDRRSQIWFLVPHSARWMGIRLDFVCTLFVAVSTFTGVFSTTDAGKVKLLDEQVVQFIKKKKKLVSKLREVKSQNVVQLVTLASRQH